MSRASFNESGPTKLQACTKSIPRLPGYSGDSIPPLSRPPVRAMPVVQRFAMSVSWSAAGWNPGLNLKETGQLRWHPLVIITDSGYYIERDDADWRLDRHRLGSLHSRTFPPILHVVLDLTPDIL